MRQVVILMVFLILSGCSGLSMLPDSGTKLEKSPCACEYEAINHG
ncbi:hypothetical protein SAMN05216316_3095 [Nitrosovibrio sp. Nv6]|nr:hypothetical protein SAMN05216316_3095 [Nitrosovibrio sp. Nv6]